MFVGAGFRRPLLFVVAGFRRAQRQDRLKPVTTNKAFGERRASATGGLRQRVADRRRFGFRPVGAKTEAVVVVRVPPRAIPHVSKATNGYGQPPNSRSRPILPD